MKRLVLAVAVLGTAGFLAVAPANAAALCLSADISVNGEQQELEQCLPPAE